MTKRVYSDRPFVRGLPITIQRPARACLIYERMLWVCRDDLLLAAYPKSGGTWFRFMMASALTGDEMSYDRVQVVCPPLGKQRGGPTFRPAFRRMIKTHERPIFVRRPPTAIYLVRDGRDVAVSYYHHMQSLGYELDDFATYLADYLEGRIGPYGAWQNHVSSWIKHCASDPARNMVLHYEDLLADPVGQLLAVSEFLKLGLAHARIERAVEMSTVTRMRAKEATSELLASRLKFSGQFVRTARAGGWRAAFTPSLAELFIARAGRALTSAGYGLDTSR